MQRRFVGGRATALLATVMVVAGSLPLPTRAAVAPEPIEASSSPSAVSPTVELGQYAVNGTVRAALVDESTGTTYLGGDFTRIGRLTGPVAVVDPPETSDGDLRAASPSVLGNVVAVFADDRAGDPGFFIVGRLRAINGTVVPDRPVHRLHVSGAKWVVDPTWVVSGGCHTGNMQFPMQMVWYATPDSLVGGGFAAPSGNVRSATGLTVIDRDTGKLQNVGSSVCGTAENVLPAIPQLPAIAGCGSQRYCAASVSNLSLEPTSGRLLVAYHYVVGNVDPQQWDGLAAYDLTPGTGGRTWTRALHTGSAANPERRPGVALLGALPGYFLVGGSFPLGNDLGDAKTSRLLLVDAATGAIRQRWNPYGEQDLGSGSAAGEASDCETHLNLQPHSMARVGSQAYGWVQGSGELCEFSISGGLLVSSLVGSISVDDVIGRRLPGTPYVAPGGATYLLGSHAAVDLANKELADWNPDPAVATSGEGPTVAVLPGTIILAGEFRFLRGTPSHAIVALDADLKPRPGFVSPLAPPHPYQGVSALALTQGRLLVGGSALLPGRDGSIVAVDAVTGALDDWVAAATPPVVVDSIVVGPGRDFWISGFSDERAPAVAVQHYAPLDDGGSGLPAPVFGCLTAPVVGGSSEPTCVPEWGGRTRVRSLLLDEGGRLYVAGAFGKVAGTPRRGLARIEADGSVAGWDPDLLGVIPIPVNGGIDQLEPHALQILGDRLVVAGQFTIVRPNPNGGYTASWISPLVVFSVSSGALLRPTDPARTTWINLPDWHASGFDMVHTPGGLAVAFGEAGMAILDATTLELDVAASAPYLDTDWMTRVAGNGIYALATPSSPNTVAGMATAAAGASRLVMGGSIPRWKDRIAGNVFRTTVSADTIAPTSTTPRAFPRPDRALSSTTNAIPSRVTWTGADPHGSGVKRYELWVSTAGGPFVGVNTKLVTPTADVSLAPGKTYRFRVRAIDYAGNVGSWKHGPTIRGQLVQQTSTAIKYSKGWATVSGVGFLGGSVKKRSLAGASASFKFTGLGVGFVTTKAPDRGQVKVYVDGKFIRTIDLRATTTRPRVVVWSWSWATSGTHTVRLVVVGTSGRPRVDVDAFAVIR